MELFDEFYQKLLLSFPTIGHLWEHLYECRQHWGHPWTRSFATLGIATTGRAESCNSCLKKLVRSRSQLSDVISATKSTFQAYCRSRSVAEVRHEASRPLDVNSMKIAIRTLVPRFFAEAVLKEYAKQEGLSWIFCREESHRWKIDVGVVLYEVSIPESTAECSCGFFMTYLLPCAHILYILRMSCVNLQRKHLHGFWYHNLCLNAGSVSMGPSCYVPPPRIRHSPESFVETVNHVPLRREKLWVLLKKAFATTQNDAEAIEVLEGHLKQFLGRQQRTDLPDVREPDRVKHRGRPPGSRESCAMPEVGNECPIIIQGDMSPEPTLKKSRCCSICHRAGHNARNITFHPK